MIDDYLRKTGQLTYPGQISSPDANGPERKPDKREFVEPAFELPGIWTIPVWLASEANTRDHRGKTTGRNAAVKKAVWRALGPHWKIWGPFGDRVRALDNGPFCYGMPIPKEILPSIRVIRLGGRGLDTGNLWRAVKAVEDAIAILLGCDDGKPGWKDSFHVDQEPGPLWGCRIEMRPPPLVETGREVPESESNRS